MLPSPAQCPLWEVLLGWTDMVLTALPLGCEAKWPVEEAGRGAIMLDEQNKDSATWMATFQDTLTFLVPQQVLCSHAFTPQ